MARGRKTGGRQKNTPNKVTGAVKDMVLQALSGVGGVEYLKMQAAENPTAFLTLVGKAMPLQMTGANDAPLIPPGSIFQIALTQIPGAENQT